MAVTCDTTFENRTDYEMFPGLSCFPPVNTYTFHNFPRFQSHAFENVTFLGNGPILIKLTNTLIIETEAFSNTFIIPDNSTLSIEIENTNSASSMTLKTNAFNHLKIDNLLFSNINNFNGKPLFETNCFGTELDIDNLIFDQCGITGFSNPIRKAADVNHLSIRNSPGLVQITPTSLPSFLATTKSLEISNTNLKIIHPHTFQAWTLMLEELIITNNSNFEILSSDIVDGVLMKLEKLDLSYNPIRTLDSDYNWLTYSYTKELLLRNQQLDLFLKSNILKALPYLKTIDLSGGFIGKNNDNLIKTFFANNSNLVSIDVSYTNLAENMIIDLLTSISQTAVHFTNIRLLGHALTDENFCSYFKIFKNAPNLLDLQLDDQHECNCVTDLFYGEKIQNGITNDSVLIPLCLFNSSRTVCDINTQLAISKCGLNRQKPDNSDNNIGKYSSGAVIGVTVLVILLLGFTTVRQVRRRRNTDLTMDQPVENPLAAIIEERLQKST